MTVDAPVIPVGLGVTVTADEGYTFNGWNPNRVPEILVGGQTYTFTALFRTVGGGGGSGGVTPTPELPEEDL